MVLCVKLNAIKPLHMQFGCGGTSQLECIQKLWYYASVKTRVEEKYFLSTLKLKGALPI